MARTGFAESIKPTGGDIRLKSRWVRIRGRIPPRAPRRGKGLFQVPVMGGRQIGWTIQCPSEQVGQFMIDYPGLPQIWYVPESLSQLDFIGCVGSCGVFH